MTRDGLIEVMARAQLGYLYPIIEGYPCYDDLTPEAIEILQACATAALAAIEAAGVRLVPVAITPLIGWHLQSNLATCNPPSEIHAANWRDAWAAAVAASPYAAQKDESHEWLSGVMPEASFGKMISAVRTKMGLSLQEVADACHVSKTHIWELEQERTANPSARLVWDLSQVLSIEPGFLLKAAALSAPSDSP